MDSTVLHVDMDAFYASVEKNRKDIQGAVVVCVYSGRTEDSGAVSTCSYEARKLGIHAAMPIKEAKNIASQKDQDVKFVPMDKEYYKEVSQQINKQIYQEKAETVEQASIDEAYLKINSKLDEAEYIAKEIQKEVRDKFSLTCSIGIATNKLVAKIASDQDKPNGITKVRKSEILDFMDGLELDEIHGIGDKTIKKLSEHGINNVKDLRNTETGFFVGLFGEKQGIKIKQKSKGQTSSKVKETKQKQFTRITTLKQNSSFKGYIEKYFPNLAKEINNEIEKRDKAFRKVSLIVVDSEIGRHSKTTTLTNHVQDKELIIENGRNLLEKFLNEFQGKVRRIGLRVSDLKDFENQSNLEDF